MLSCIKLFMLFRMSDFKSKAMFSIRWHENINMMLSSRRKISISIKKKFSQNQNRRRRFFTVRRKKRSKTLREQFIQLFNSMLFHASIGIESFKGPLLTTIIIYTINHVLFLWQNKTKLTMFDKLLDSV